MLMKNMRNNDVEVKLTRKGRISNVKEECYGRGVGVVLRKSRKNNNVKEEWCQGGVGGEMSKKKITSMRSAIK
jgi:hypothetical protein